MSVDTVQDNATLEEKAKRGRRTKAEMEADAAAEKATAIDDSVFEAELTAEERLARISATVEGKVYTFPLNDPEDLGLSLALGAQFQVENLKVGQILTVNLHMNAMMIMPELGVTLDIDNPHYAVPEGLTFSKKRYIVERVRSGGLWIGKLNIHKRENVVASSNLNPKEYLERPIKLLRDDLKELISKGTDIRADGTIISPAVDLRMLIDYEVKNGGRKEYLDLLRRALSKIHGAVEFVDKMTEVKSLRMSEVPANAPLPKSNPNAVSSFM